ncbi:MAG TPA: class I adenylate-forming enzyme family protein [Actinophytocola sp.]|uniref:class I adenylate-forming enzyme family protein n=1 Tax=Actinophytocola sp. TaxID=1872138 RepID=UPI002DB6ED5E|nr:class I adenylate-forming enzyme family protein [Actinophytocola sp.]HEU5471326.1 class I adenylate-forming enzyme family protein [Actinophytocola sp.]
MTATLLHELLDAATAGHPDRAAVGRADGTLSYRDLTAASHRIARGLADRGVRRGDRVLVALPPEPLLPALLFGCSRAGAVFCVLDDAAPAAAYAHVLDDAEPALVVTANPDAARLAADRGIGRAAPAELAGTRPGPAPDGPIPVDPICLIYTSGSTGLPKAVVSTHAQLCFAVAAIQSQLGYRETDVVFCPLPLSFDYGLYQIFLATAAGARVQLATAADAGPRLLAELHRCGATVLPAVPGVARGLARLLSRPGATPPPLRLVTNTGSTMPDGVLAELRGRIPGLGVQLMFGLTECKRTTIMPVDEDLRRPGSCGRALPGTEVFAIGPDGTRLPPGEVGELVVRGPHVMAGYWRRPEQTAQRFPRDAGLFPRLRTGDYGWCDEDGYLYFVGRRDDLYKQRGFRVSATEVELAATRIAGVESAAVLPPGAERAEATLFAVTALEPAEVLARLRTELEEFKVPGRCVVVRSIPSTTNGKIDRAALARMPDGSHV